VVGGIPNPHRDTRTADDEVFLGPESRSIRLKPTMASRCVVRLTLNG
jgi:hypothetical protein